MGGPGSGRKKGSGGGKKTPKGYIDSKSSTGMTIRVKKAGKKQVMNKGLGKDSAYKKIRSTQKREASK